MKKYFKKQISLLFAFVIIVSSISVPLQITFAKDSAQEESTVQSIDDYEKEPEVESTATESETEALIQQEEQEEATEEASEPFEELHECEQAVSENTEDIDYTENTDDSQRVDLPDRSMVSGSSGEWRQDGTGVRFYLYATNTYVSNSWINCDSSIYYVGSNGYKYTYYKTIGGYNYYFNGAGIRQTGWIKFNSDNKWRYFDQSDGKQHKGWLSYESNWYYLDSNGIMVVYLQTIGDYTYYFNGAGIMQTGWINFAAGWRCFNPDGKMYTYYNCINGTYYYFNGAGIMQTGMIQFSGFKRYFNSDGSEHHGWLKLGSVWYYFDSADGKMAIGWKSINTRWFLFDDNGYMQTGWKEVSNNWYFLENDSTENHYGYMHTGWLIDNYRVYYLSSSGAMQTGTCTISGYAYTFASDGHYSGTHIDNSYMTCTLSSGTLITLNLKLYPQGPINDDQRTWAACALMVGNYRESSLVGKTELLSHVGYMYDYDISIPEIAESINLASQNNKQCSINGLISFTAMKQQLCKGKPFVVAMHYDQIAGGGVMIPDSNAWTESVVITGFSANNGGMLYAVNPKSSVNNGYVAYDDFTEYQSDYHTMTTYTITYKEV